MRVHAPLTLLEQARQRLLREEALTIAAVEYLPMQLLPVIFEEAFRYRRTKILKALVSAWPFPCLPVGALIKEPHLKTLKALLEGLDVLITQKAHPSRCKLRVLDLRNVHHDFWVRWAGSRKGDCSPQVTTRKQPVKTCPDSGVKEYLKVVTDLKHKEGSHDEYTMYLLEWARQRKGAVHLCCRKLQIWDSPNPTLIETFQIIEPVCLQELELDIMCVEHLAPLRPYIEQMKNLDTLTLDDITRGHYPRDSEELQRRIRTLISHFPKSHSIQTLFIKDVSIIAGHLPDFLSFLDHP